MDARAVFQRKIFGERAGAGEVSRVCSFSRVGFSEFGFVYNERNSLKILEVYNPEFYIVFNF